MNDDKTYWRDKYYALLEKYVALNETLLKEKQSAKSNKNPKFPKAYTKPGKK
jgi:hypothetical protein